MASESVVFRNCPRHQHCKGKIASHSKTRYCGSCQKQLIDLLEKHKSLEYYSDKDLCFIFDHPQGCLGKKLCSHLDLSTTTFNTGVRQGKITLERTWKTGKEVHKQICFREMVRVIDRMHNWRSIYQVAIEKGVRYYTLRRYADDGYFGPIEENLEGLKSIHVKYLVGFDKRWAKAKASYEKSRMEGKRNLLQGDEIHLGIAASWIGNNESNLWKYYHKGYLKGCSQYGMTVVKIVDFKEFLLAVASGKVPVSRSVLGTWKSSPLANDKSFVAKVNRRLEKELQETFLAFGKRLRVLGADELGVIKVVEITSAGRPAVNRWFRDGRIASCKDGGVYSTTLAKFKEFIRAVYKRQLKIDIRNVEAALAHPLIAEDVAYVQEIKGLSI